MVHVARTNRPTVLLAAKTYGSVFYDKSRVRELWVPSPDSSRLKEWGSRRAGDAIRAPIGPLKAHRLAAFGHCLDALNRQSSALARNGLMRRGSALSLLSCNLYENQESTS